MPRNNRWIFGRQTGWSCSEFCILLVYLAVKCAIVVVGHWFEGFMNLARLLETFRF